jgi:hypothetical protein
MSTMDRATMTETAMTVVPEPDPPPDGGPEEG